MAVRRLGLQIVEVDPVGDHEGNFGLEDGCHVGCFYSGVGGGGGSVVADSLL